MQKTVILTAKTLEGLNACIQEWTIDSWKLYEGIVVTAWEDKRLPDGQPGMLSEAIGFAQTLTKTVR